MGIYGSKSLWTGMPGGRKDVPSNLLLRKIGTGEEVT
jgi:hypothetical protein